MNVVIADSSCLILFTNIDRLDVLEKMFGQVWITESVASEYGLQLPNYISIDEPRDQGRLQALNLLLDPGESSSIALAIEHFGSRIVNDEKKGRRIAKSLGLNVTGTLGVLSAAANKIMITADESLIAALDSNGFRLSARLKNRLLERE